MAELNSSSTTGTCRLAITRDMTIYHAIEQKAELLEALAGGQTLELDLAQVPEMDTAGLQLLLLAKREASKAGKEVRVTAHSAAVHEVIEFTQLAAHFGDPMLITANEAH